MPFNVPGFTSSTPIASAVSGMNIPQPLLSQKVTIVTANAPGVIPQSHAPPGYVRPEEGDYNNSMGYLENGNQRFYHHHPGFWGCWSVVRGYCQVHIYAHFRVAFVVMIFEEYRMSDIWSCLLFILFACLCLLCNVALTLLAFVPIRSAFLVSYVSYCLFLLAFLF